ncbi:hypothetical protein MHM88_04390 [Epibacterium sp. MM17-32]|uniref:hypothetical protein n=1 Tax=Epibacterium sp. MM17-32 TaxID=2917734 RepID=UPI001EF6CC9C|nr:hypothetical protein [Epibacterium sp. MM17-32]MCG7627031.1 hypothetical protein [Epibacterium sp. MM17-32]
MTRVLMVLGVAAFLGACGVDGEPVRPSLNAGLGISNSGIHLGGALGVSKGPVTVSVGL